MALLHQNARRLRLQKWASPVASVALSAAEFMTATISTAPLLAGENVGKPMVRVA